MPAKVIFTSNTHPVTEIGSEKQCISRVARKKNPLENIVVYTERHTQVKSGSLSIGVLINYLLCIPTWELEVLDI